MCKSLHLNTFIYIFYILILCHFAQTSKNFPDTEVQNPWYMDKSASTTLNNPPMNGIGALKSIYHKIMSHLDVHHRPPAADSCLHECVTTLDCPSSSMSCFQASKQRKGCCLKVLKPNDTGCVLHEQCRRACETSFCDHSQFPSRCICDQDRHFLFNKCWNKCPDFAHSDPVIDTDGFSRCVLRIDSQGALKHMRRSKRQYRASYC